MKSKILSLALFVVMCLTVSAQPQMNRGAGNIRGPQNNMWRNQNRPDLAKALNLTDEQKEAFKKIRLAMHKEILPLRNEIGEAVAHQKTLLSAEKPDLSAIDKNIDKIGTLKIELAKIAVKHRLDMRALLTDEQRMKFDAWKESMKHRMGQRFGRPGMRMGTGMNMQ
jgi:Spy/CpxP family protein refolding chaperone